MRLPKEFASQGEGLAKDRLGLIEFGFIGKEKREVIEIRDPGWVLVAQKLPILVGDQDLVSVPGVVAAVGPDQRALGKICGRMTARILDGAKPADLAIEHPTFELLVNLKSAGSLGVAVPQRALEQAVRVVR